MKPKFALVHGHPRLWLRPTELQKFKRDSLHARKPFRQKILRRLESVLADLPADEYVKSAPQHMALALGQAWRLTGDEKYARAAWRLLEELEVYAGNSGGYSAWGLAAEAAAILYDWLHDYWKKIGREQDVAQAALIFGRRALEDLLRRYILDDWHNYGLALQSGVLAVALAVGHDHPKLEDGSLLKTIEQIHLTGYAYEGLRIQDMFYTPPTTMNLSAALAARDFAGSDCLHEATGYHIIDVRAIVNMAELWTRAQAGKSRAVVWPELTRAGHALLQTLRPDGKTVTFGDSTPGRLHWRNADVLSMLHARTPEPVFAERLRAYDMVKNHPLPIFQLLYATPEMMPRGKSKRPADPLPPSWQAGRLTLMRSGWKPTDTFVSFSCGDFGGWHNHHDWNTFTLFRGGELAIDPPGAFYTGSHRQEWHMRTAAHNGILVRDPKEKFWKGRHGKNVPNDGGQRFVSLSYSPPHTRTGAPNPVLTEERRARLHDEFSMGKVIVFEPGDSFDYVAGDATRAYTYPWSGIGDNPSRRVEEAVRQIVFLKPDWIVIFDRVESTRPEFIKQWLLHTYAPAAWTVRRARKRAGPGIVALPENGPFTFEHEAGRMTLWPLLPAARAVRSIGGPGYECWIDGAGADGKGKNFPPEDADKRPTHYRFDVSPTQPGTRHCFLTVLHAGLKKDAPASGKFGCTVIAHDGFSDCRITRANGDELASVKFRDSGPIEVEVNIPGECAYHRNTAPERVPVAPH